MTNRQVQRISLMASFARAARGSARMPPAVPYIPAPKLDPTVASEIRSAEPGVLVLWAPERAGKRSAIRHSLSSVQPRTSLIISPRSRADNEVLKNAVDHMTNFTKTLSASPQGSLPTVLIEDLDRFAVPENEKLAVMLSLANSQQWKAVVTISDLELAATVLKQNGGQKNRLLGWSKFQSEPLLMRWTSQQCFSLISRLFVGPQAPFWTAHMREALLQACDDQLAVTPGCLIQLYRRHRGAREQTLPLVIADFRRVAAIGSAWEASMINLLDLDV